MNEVEKLYEKANIKPKQKGYCDWDSNCPYPHHKCNDECPYWKYEDESKYPPFTTEKQIELIKLLIKDYYYYLDTIDVNNFENSLAKLINDLWQSLVEEERKQIKEILE